MVLAQRSRNWGLKERIVVHEKHGNEAISKFLDARNIIVE